MCPGAVGRQRPHAATQGFVVLPPCCERMFLFAKWCSKQVVHEFLLHGCCEDVLYCRQGSFSWAGRPAAVTYRVKVAERNHYVYNLLLLWKTTTHVGTYNG